MSVGRKRDVALTCLVPVHRDMLRMTQGHLLHILRTSDRRPGVASGGCLSVILVT